MSQKICINQVWHVTGADATVLLVWPAFGYIYIIVYPAEQPDIYRCCNRSICDGLGFYAKIQTIFVTVCGRYLFSRCGVGACSCRISQRRTLYRYLYSTQVNKETYSLVLTITHSRIPWDFLHFTPPSSPICTIYYKTMFPPFFLFADQRLIFSFFLS